ncbi:MAG: hypothetical protein ABI036_09375 [Fibrobacteria bacterium]
MKASKNNRKADLLDEDLGGLTREQLIAEIRELRNGIRAHRDASRHELCWHHPRLWGLLPEKTEPLPTVPEWPQFLDGCIQYRKSLDKQAADAPRTKISYQGKK